MTSLSYRIFIKLLKLISEVERIRPFAPKHDIVLCYHDVGSRKWDFSITPKEFERQIIYLKTKFEVVPASEIVRNARKFSKPRAAITFDDGYEGVYKYAYPILQKHNLTAAVFVVGVNNISRQTGYGAKLMRKSHIGSLRDSGWEVGWHSKNHRNLESLGARALLHELKSLREEYKMIAYPYGKYDPYVIEYAKKAGFELGFTVDGDSVNENYDNLAIPRITVSRGITESNFIALVSPLGVFVNRIFTALWRHKNKISASRTLDSQIVISSYDDIANPVYAGGGAIAIHEMAKRISNNFKVKVISWNHSGKTEEIIEGVFYKRIGLKSFNPKFAQLVFQFSLPVIVLTQQFNLWIESFGPPLTTAFLPLILKKKVIGVVHMLSSEEMERKYRLPFGIVEKIGLRKYANIVATSEPLKSKILAISPDSHVEVIGNGVDRISAPMGKRRKQILFLGRLEIEQKGLDLLVEGFKKFASTESGEGYKLVVAGNGAPGEFNKLKSLVRAAGIRKSVIFLGRVEGKQKERLFSSSSCIVVSSRFETFGMVALEAMAHGLPVVAFDINGLLWTPKEAALKVPPFDTEALSKAIALASTEKNKSEKLSKTGLVYAKRFTWDRIAARYEDYLGRIIYG